jgi:thiol:disulfide interchange protein DsbA
MGRFVTAVFCTLALALATGANAAPTWAEGTHYVVLSPMQHTSVPAGKIEVMEVFSYGCPACNNFQPVAERLKHDLPANAQMTYLPASFHPDEDWPMFQRAYFAAQALNIADRTHQAIYDAIWKTGELAVFDPVTHQLKRQQPTIEDAARFYQKLTGVTPEAFLGAARSFTVDLKVKQANAQILAMEVPGTPCIVVNGKYRVLMDSVGSNYDQLIELVRYLVARESAH